MKSSNIILTGLGGQGILFMTRILAQTALDNGYNVVGAETHGMAQRGGSVVSHLRLGEVQGSLVQTGTAHLLLALDEHEGYRNLSFLSRKGRLFVNTNANHFPLEDVQAFLDKREIVYRAVPAGVMALELGAPRSSNLALLGFFSAFSEKPFTFGEILHTIEKISPDRLKEINRKVFEAGHQRAKKSTGGFCDLLLAVRCLYLKTEASSSSERYPRNFHNRKEVSNYPSGITVNLNQRRRHQ